MSNIENENDTIDYEDNDQDNDEDNVHIKNKSIETKFSDSEIKNLFRDYKDRELILQPDFQRNFVWDNKKCSLLVESILLNIPLPIIYLAQENDDIDVVIDGQQRLTAIFNFIDGKFSLTGLDVLNNLNRSYFKDLDKEQQKQIQSYTFRVITLTKNNDENLKFNIFKRLNTGAVSLNDMELRNCIYQGTYNNFIKKLSENETFRKLIGIEKSEARMKDRELVLRFLAFCNQTYLNYKASIKVFLNNEMTKNINDKTLIELEKKFKDTLEVIENIFGEKPFNRTNKKEYKFNVALYDVYMGVLCRYDKNLMIRNSNKIKKAISNLIENDETFAKSITFGTNKKENIDYRFTKLKEIIDNEIKDDNKQDRCFSLEFKKELFEKDPTCKICNNIIESIDMAEVDHIEQYGQGGETTVENARLAHRNCNRTRPRKE